jgi:hypothetical protein
MEDRDPIPHLTHFFYSEPFPTPVSPALWFSRTFLYLSLDLHVLPEDFFYSLSELLQGFTLGNVAFSTLKLKTGGKLYLTFANSLFLLEMELLFIFRAMCIFFNFFSCSVC